MTRATALATSPHRRSPFQRASRNMGRGDLLRPAPARPGSYCRPATATTAAPRLFAALAQRRPRTGRCAGRLLELFRRHYTDRRDSAAADRGFRPAQHQLDGFLRLRCTPVANPWWRRERRLGRGPCGTGRAPARPARYATPPPAPASRSNRRRFPCWNRARPWSPNAPCWPCTTATISPRCSGATTNAAEGIEARRRPGPRSRRSGAPGATNATSPSNKSSPPAQGPYELG